MAAVRKSSLSASINYIRHNDPIRLLLQGKSIMSSLIPSSEFAQAWGQAKHKSDGTPYRPAKVHSRGLHLELVLCIHHRQLFDARVFVLQTGQTRDTHSSQSWHLAHLAVVSLQVALA